MPQGVWVHCGECGCESEDSAGLSLHLIDHLTPRNSGGFFFALKSSKNDQTRFIGGTTLNSQQIVLFLIHSLAPAGSEGDTAWAAGEFLASTRIQLEPAKRAAIELGLKTKILNLRSEDPDCINAIGDPSCCIVGKLSHPDKDFAQRILLANLSAISILKSKGIPVIVNYSDNLAAPSNRPTSDLYQSLLWHADAVIYPCKAMQKLGKAWINKRKPPKEIIIEDPWQIQTEDYQQLKSNQPCKIIWFGHSSNAKYLLREIPHLLQDCNTHSNYELTILSDTGTLEKARKAFKANPQNKPWSLRCINWQTEKQPTQLAHELKRAHLSIIPSDIKDPRKLAASHNRAVDAIQSGCMVIASPLPSYQELKKLLLITEDFAGTINKGIEQYARLTKKWGLDRNNYLYRFSPSSNISNWKKLINTQIHPE